MYKKKVRNGYTTITMYYDHALRDMPTAQCGVMFPENGGVLFVSYTTPVIYIDNNGWLTCTGTYSLPPVNRWDAFSANMPRL